MFRIGAPGGGLRDIGRIGPGDFYGEHSILAGGVSHAALIAESDVRAAVQAASRDSAGTDAILL